ncbi:MAG: DNA repair protein RecO [Rhodospirillales bacterium]
MEWRDDAFVLSARPHGESAAVVMLLTRGHGRHAGLVHGGAGRRKRAMLQPGARVAAAWRARIADHLGTLTCEPAEAGGGSAAALALADAGRLAALSAACAVAETALAERETAEAVFDGFAVLMGALAQNDPAWPSVYVKWELGVLEALGFGLDLRACAATGQTDDLIYVSPKSGRAVSRGAGAPHKDVLAPLPAFLINPGAAGDAKAVSEGLRLTGYFLNRHVYAEHTSPAARARLTERMRKKAEAEGAEES